MQRRSFCLSWCLTLWTLALAPHHVFAHAIGVDCAIRGDRIEVEAFYDDDTPAREAAVLILDAQAKIIARGTTDVRGKWEFTAPAPGKYEVRIDAGAGHRARCQITMPARTKENSAPTPSGNETMISAGPGRAEFTRIPWLKVLIGLAVIGACSGAFLLASLLRRRAQTQPNG